ncbi:hypothetical protein JNUCC83_03065 [Vagococcus sp. JNUCC 83]
MTWVFLIIVIFIFLTVFVSNFTTTKTKYDIIEKNQKNLGYEFWDSGNYEDTYLKTDRGKLYVREFLQENSNKWAILVHGYRKTGKEDMSFYGLNFYSKILIINLSCQKKT